MGRKLVRSNYISAIELLLQDNANIFGFFFFFFFFFFFVGGEGFDHDRTTLLTTDKAPLDIKNCDSQITFFASRYRVHDNISEILSAHLCHDKSLILAAFLLSPPFIEKDSPEETAKCVCGGGGDKL